ncbi:MAG TPA: UrcA family protein [Steroidobacteraceae bacterium]|jgi:UrcA family protein
MSRFAPNVSSRPRALAALAAMSALTTAALLALPSVASAAQPAADAPPQTIVQYSFNELATDGGTRAVYARIKRAAAAVCPSYDPMDLEMADVSKMCQRQAMARAVNEIGNARLAAVYKGHSVKQRG